MTQEPQYPFGFGLTYTSFDYQDLSIDNNYKVSVTIKNTGKIDSEEVVQLYISSPLAGKGDPIYDLKAFQRVFVKAGETRTIIFNLSKSTFEQFDENGKNIIRNGTYTVYVNGSLPSQRSKVLGGSIAIKASVKF